jgi:hypothetical protein
MSCRERSADGADVGQYETSNIPDERQRYHKYLRSEKHNILADLADISSALFYKECKKTR